MKEPAQRDLTHLKMQLDNKYSLIYHVENYKKSLTIKENTCPH